MREFFKIAKKYEDIKSPENNLRSDGEALLFSNNIISGVLICPEIANDIPGAFIRYGMKSTSGYFYKDYETSPRDIPVIEIFASQTSNQLPIGYQGGPRAFHVSIILAKYAVQYENKMLNYKYFETLPKGKYFYSFDFCGVYLKHENGQMGFLIKSKEIY